MADNYTQFSEQIENITPEEAKWLNTVLGICYDEQMINTPEDFKAVLSDMLNLKVEELVDVDPDWWPGFEWSLKSDNALWIHCDEGFQESHLTLVMQAFIQRFRPDFIFTLSGACSCSRPRIGEFGGIWIVVTKDTVIGGSTWSEIEEVVDALTPGKNDGKPT